MEQFLCELMMSIDEATLLMRGLGLGDHDCVI